MGGVIELEPGEVFAGRYEVQRLLGEGDRKRTYLARDRKVDRLVALSLVKPNAVISDPEGTEREAKVGSPALCGIHGFGYSAGTSGHKPPQVRAHLAIKG